MITEKDMTRQEMEKRAIDSRCLVCGAGLSVAWGGMWGIESYVLRCSNDHKHEGIERPFSPSPMDIPGYNLPSVELARRKRMEKTLGPVKTNALERYIGSVHLTKEDAEHILTTIWPDAPKVEIFKAAMICQQYGLNPLMKHLFLIGFNKKDRNGNIIGQSWEVVIGIKANRFLASKFKAYSYIDGPRIMKAEEQADIFGAASKTHLWAICKIQDRDGNIAVGYGNWPLDKVVKGEDKGNTQANMAFIRAERQALDRLSPGTLPEDVGVIDEAYVEVPIVTERRPPQVAVPENTATRVDTVTGEVPMTAEEEITFAESAAAAPAPSPAAPPTPAPPFVEHKVEPSWLKESLKKLRWSEITAKSWILANINSAIDTQGALIDVLDRMVPEQRDKFVSEVNNRLKAAG